MCVLASKGSMAGWFASSSSTVRGSGKNLAMPSGSCSFLISRPYALSVRTYSPCCGCHVYKPPVSARYTGLATSAPPTLNPVSRMPISLAVYLAACASIRDFFSGVASASCKMVPSLTSRMEGRVYRCEMFSRTMDWVRLVVRVCAFLAHGAEPTSTAALPIASPSVAVAGTAIVPRYLGKARLNAYSAAAVGVRSSLPRASIAVGAVTESKNW